MGSPDPTARRLEELAALCVEGDATAAEFELTDWVQREDCPAPARILLAAIRAHRADWRGARAALGEVLLARVHHYDPRIVQTLIGVLLAQGLHDTAERLATGLRRMRPGDGHFADWLTLMAFGGEGGVSGEVAACAREAEPLAHDLVSSPQLIATLVYAQKQEPHQHEIALLRVAIERVEADLAFTEHHASACLALAELAELAGNAADARQWAERGLAIDPYSAPLALVLDRATDDPTAASHASQALDKVSQRHPSYPDVRAALIRREFATGQRGRAAQRLRDWLQREPESHMALQVQRELAA